MRNVEKSKSVEFAKISHHEMPKKILAKISRFESLLIMIVVYKCKL